MNIQNIFQLENSAENVDNEIPEVDVDQLTQQIESLQADSGTTEVQINLKRGKHLLSGNNRKVRNPSWNGNLKVQIPKIIDGNEDKFRCGR